LENSQNKSIFKGLVVTSFSWAIVGPLSMKYLADFGATVIRVETAKRPCTLRISTPYKDNQAGLNRSGYFNHFSSNILSLALNMENPQALDLVHKLVAKSDVVMENFTPGVMEKWGITYESLKKVKPDIIMLRQSGFGNEGPNSHQPAFGMILAAMAGIPNFIGQPEGSPLPIGVSAYTDGISPRFAIAALIAALDYRNKTGKGQYLDISQFETAMSFIAPALLDYSVNGREPVRQGNTDADQCPHEVYRCQGDDRWCAIAVASQAQWSQLCSAIGRPDLAGAERFSNLAKRKSQETEINQIITAWTAQRSAETVMDILQKAGVPAGVVKNAADIYQDPQLAERGLFWKMEHPEMGQFTHLGQGFELSKTPAQARLPSPLLGEHSEQVCTQILGMSDSEFAEAAGNGLFE
jgi:benzylsuccinate CoA-transferase BbsF subunit